MRISDWSSDVCSSDLPATCQHEAEPGGARQHHEIGLARDQQQEPFRHRRRYDEERRTGGGRPPRACQKHRRRQRKADQPGAKSEKCVRLRSFRSEEHTSELQSLMRISYAVFCLKKKKPQTKMPPAPSNHTNSKSQQHLYL